MSYEFDRRGFLKAGAAAGLGATFGGVQLAASAAKSDLPLAKEIDLPAIEEVRIGIIGMGGRGNGLMGNLLEMKEAVRIKAVCDIYPERAAAAAERVAAAGQPRPESYSGSEDVLKKLVDRGDP